MNRNRYFEQTELMITILPYVMDEKCFALKGGTAINFFYQNMPRLSVDIDLTYLSLLDRQSTLEMIGRALDRISQTLEKAMPRCKVSKKVLKGKTSYVVKLIIQLGDIQVKIEPNLTLRGYCYEPQNKKICDKSIKTFKREIDCNVMSFEDVYAGKMCAALDRQHPRDLFDIMLLLKKSDITKRLMEAFVVYLSSTSRPMSEILNPNKIEIQSTYEKTFNGMTNDVVSVIELEEARSQLIKEIKKKLTINQKKFLLSLKMGNPNFKLLTIPHVSSFPSIQWKVLNINKMSVKEKNKAIDKLRDVLEI